MSKKIKIPPVGMRIIKSAIAVGLCYIVQLFRGDDGIVFYSQLSALWCMQSYVSTTLKNAVQRTIGTVIGAIAGLISLLLITYIRNNYCLTDNANYILTALIVSVMIIPVIWITVLLNKKQASYFSCVVFLSIVVVHLKDQNCFFFVWNRFFDTMIGIVIGVCVNLFHLPRKYKKDILFISGLDDTLLNSEYHLNDYCKVELNRMLDSGLNFTLSTLRPPAAIIEPMKDIRLKLPVIAMDGAVLYDIHTKRYLRKIEMTLEAKHQVMSVLDEMNLIYFSNVVIDDTLLIYHQEPSDPVQQKLLKELRLSPHRNYIKQKVPENQKVIYIMMIYPDKKIEEIYNTLTSHDFAKELKLLKYPSKDYPGYSYIKIYDSFATKENMIEYLKRLLNIQKTVSFGTIQGKYDYVVEEGNTNQVVHTLKRLYE